MYEINLKGNSYFIASHQSQISQRLAALCNQGGSLVCNFFTPSDIHRLYCHAVSPNGYQRCEKGQGEEGRINISSGKDIYLIITISPISSLNLFLKCCV